MLVVAYAWLIACMKERKKKKRTLETFKGRKKGNKRKKDEKNKERLSI